MNTCSVLKLRLRKKVSLILLSLFFIQSLVPLGFMPGNLLLGEALLTVCPQQQPLMFHSLKHEGHSHEHHLSQGEGARDQAGQMVYQWAVSFKKLGLLDQSFEPLVVSARYLKEPIFDSAYYFPEKPPVILPIRGPPVIA